jgi:microsomal dipeptidase-like Zn-dependent dipeptidase
MIADLHCDLLSYLTCHHSHTAMHPESRCSLPQLEKGGVKLQVLAAYSDTKKKSVPNCQKQIDSFFLLPELYPQRFVHLNSENFCEKKEISIVLAIENGSGLIEEDEKLELFFNRFDALLKRTSPLYISLTWNHENRLGGGNLSKKGLSVDGERVLDYLDNKKIAIDLSHTSDALAYDILSYIDKKSLSLIPIASHSNFRAISDQARNLPDAIAIEIVKRGGVIGLNFVRLFIGPTHAESFLEQVEHARALGALDHLCFGADFFYSDQFLSSIQHLLPIYFSKYSDASCYPELLRHLSTVLNNSELKKLSIENVIQFLQRL